MGFFVLSLAPTAQAKRHRGKIPLSLSLSPLSLSSFSAPFFPFLCAGKEERRGTKKWQSGRSLDARRAFPSFYVVARPLARLAALFASLYATSPRAPAMFCPPDNGSTLYSRPSPRRQVSIPTFPALPSPSAGFRGGHMGRWRRRPPVGTAGRGGNGGSRRRWRTEGLGD